ncbi:MAG: phosphatidylglycerophosphatase A family protein [Candidatus Acidiferrales bacterium]
MSRTADSVAPPPSSSTTPQRPPRLALLIATGFGLGYLPKAPGTWGSLGGVGVAFLFWHYWNPWFPLHRMGVDILSLSTSVLWILNYLPLVLVALIGVWSAGKTARWKNISDPQEVVVDEMSGQLLALLIPMGQCRFVPEGVFFFVGLEEPHWKYVLAGFILFRVFDIWKPWPVRAAEKLPGGWGIMADDWVAGIYAAFCLWALRAAGM